MESSGDEPVYVISVAARLARLPSWVLRVLDQEGIVCPQRTDSNRRLYSQNDITLLTHVQQLMEKGVNMKGVQVILEMEREQRGLPNGTVRKDPEDVPLPSPEDIALPEPDAPAVPKSAVPRATATNPVEELALALPEVTDIVSLNGE